MLGTRGRSIEVDFGVALRRVRLAAGLTQEQLALEVGIQRDFVSLIELGRNQPTITTIAKLDVAPGMPESAVVAEAEDEALPERVKTKYLVGSRRMPDYSGRPRRRILGQMWRRLIDVLVPCRSTNREPKRSPPR
jgi:transcriptional regulator with XRE-family HTH domain